MMNSRNSLFSFALFKNTIAQCKNTALILTALNLFFCLLSNISIMYSFLTLLVFIFSSVILVLSSAVQVQKYMIQKNTATYIASMPFSNNCLFITKYLAGLFLTLVPLLIQCILMHFISNDIYGMFFENGRIVGSVFGLGIIYYTMTFFVTCMAGNRVGQLLYSIGLYVLPLGLAFGVTVMSQTIVPGLVFDFKTDIVYILFPLMSGLEYFFTGEWMSAIGHIIMVVVIFVLSYIVFCSRRVENSGDTMLSSGINVVFRVVVVIASTIIAFLIFVSLVPISTIFSTENLYFLILIFIMIGFLISMSISMIFKEENIFVKNLPNILVLAVVFFMVLQYGQLQIQEIEAELFDYPAEIYFNGPSREDMYIFNVDGDMAKEMYEYLKNSDEIHRLNTLQTNFNYITIRRYDTQYEKYVYFSIEDEDGLEFYNKYIASSRLEEIQDINNIHIGEVPLDTISIYDDDSTKVVDRDTFDKIYQMTQSITTTSDYIETYYTDYDIEIIKTDEIDALISENNIYDYASAVDGLIANYELFTDISENYFVYDVEFNSQESSHEEKRIVLNLKLDNPRNYILVFEDNGSGYEVVDEYFGQEQGEE